MVHSGPVESYIFGSYPNIEYQKNCEITEWAEAANTLSTIYKRKEKKTIVSDKVFYIFFTFRKSEFLFFSYFDTFQDIIFDSVLERWTILGLKAIGYLPSLPLQLETMGRIYIMRG